MKARDSSWCLLVGNAKTGSMTYKELDAKLNKWNSELGDQQTVFRAKAKAIRDQDMRIVDNGQKVGGDDCTQFCHALSCVVML